MESKPSLIRKVQEARRRTYALEKHLDRMAPQAKPPNIGDELDWINKLLASLTKELAKDE